LLAVEILDSLPELAGVVLGVAVTDESLAVDDASLAIAAAVGFSNVVSPAHAGTDQRPLYTVATHFVRLARSVRAKDGSAGALLGQLWLKRFSHELVDTTSWVSWLEKSRGVGAGDDLFPKHDTVVPTVPLAADARLIVVSAMLLELEAQLGVAQASLVEASTKAPLHEVLQFLRLATEALPLSQLFKGPEAGAWHTMFYRLISVASEVCDLVVGVVGSDAPEGITLEEVDGGDSSQMILVTCWRSMAQAGLLLAQVYSTVPFQASDGTAGLTEPLFLDAAERMLKLLISSRHRGAVDLLQVAFGAICNRCWHNDHPLLRRLPAVWMARLLQQMDEANPNSVTRRSAGFAAAIVAILGGDSSGSRELLSTTLRSLFAKVEAGMMEQARENSSKGSESADSVGNDGAQVSFLSQKHVSCIHALNTLRSLFRSTTIGGAMSALVGTAFLSAFEGFSSRIFPVKNSSMMLFAILLDRSFGVKRARDAAEARQSLTGREFFTRFPALYPFLLRSLGDAAETATQRGGRTSESLLPMLLLLSHLSTSPLDAVDSPYCMSLFEPALQRLCNW